MVYVVKRKILKVLKKSYYQMETLFYFINKDISVNIDNHRDFLLAKLIQKEKEFKIYDKRIWFYGMSNAGKTLSLYIKKI